MKVRALSTKPVDYVLECQLNDPKPEQVIFKLKPLSSKQFAILQDSLKVEYTKESIQKLSEEASSVNENSALEVLSKIKNFYEHIYNTLSYGLIGWENFRDSEDEVVAFSKNMEENLSMIPREYQMELATKISELSTLTPGELKNLPSQQSGPVKEGKVKKN